MADSKTDRKQIEGKADKKTDVQVDRLANRKWRTERQTDKYRTQLIILRP